MMTLEEQVAQMVVVRASGYLFDHQIRTPLWEPTQAMLRHWLETVGVGGVIFVDGSAAEMAVRCQVLQSWAKIPLLLAADIEEGVGQRFSGATWFPPPMALGAIAQTDLGQALQDAAVMGSITAQEAMTIGLNWILAPVVDVNNNPDNPVINIRSFGETPALVSQLAAAFLAGAQKYPVLTTAKHFPGHGDTAVDSHLELPVLPHSAARLAEIELPPFVDLINRGVDAVMSAHLLIPAWDEILPATLSSAILTGQLRHNLGFEGLIVTDALVMGAIVNEYGPEAAPILAVEAGADILLMPVDPEVAIQAVCDAVRKGRISPARIQASVERIWRGKRKIYGDKWPEFSLDPSPKTAIVKKSLQNVDAATLNGLATSLALETTTQILQRSLKMGGSFPLLLPSTNAGGSYRNLILVDDLLNCRFLGNHTPAVALPHQLGYDLQLVDHRSVYGGEEAADSVSTLLQVFIRGSAFRDSAGLLKIAHYWFKKLLKTGKLQALVVYGSPYALEQFLPDLPTMIPYIFSYGQMDAAQAVALETLFGLTWNSRRQSTKIA